MVRTKVFVGNLSFQTQESELATEFGNAGKVISANIITRGPRSLGYGFVEMDSEEDAKKAVTLMNKKELNGRQINVEVAKPQDETKKPRAEGEEGAPQRKPRKPRAPRNDDSEEGKVPRPRAKRNPEGANDEEGAVRKPRAPRGKPAGPRKSTEQREESKTTLFVANLPFGLNDEEFAKVLTDKQLKLKSAHVVSKKNGKSKGYGFVEFDTQEDQQKALAALHKHTVDSRELSVKVALTPSESAVEEDANQEKTEKKVVPEKTPEKKSSPAPTKASTTAEKKPATPVGEKKQPEKKTEEKKTTPAAEPKKVAAAATAATPEKKPATPIADKKTTPTTEKK